MYQAAKRTYSTDDVSIRLTLKQSAKEVTSNSLSKVRLDSGHPAESPSPVSTAHM